MHNQEHQQEQIADSESEGEGEGEGETTQAVTPASEPNPTGLLKRVGKMLRLILHDVAALTKVVHESANKLQMTMSSVARQIATTEVRNSGAHLETRKLISTSFEVLEERLATEFTERSVERLLLTIVADVIDNVDMVLKEPLKDERGTPSFRALEMIRGQLLEALRPYGVEQMPIVAGDTSFDETEHECCESDDTLVGHHVISDVYKHGYLIRGRVVRRAHVYVTGAE